MKYVFVISLLAIFFVACNSDQSKDVKTNLPEGVKEVTAIDVIQVQSYTYLKVKENDLEVWLAAPKTDIKQGEKVYYTGGMKMSNFESKELNRKFETIYFLDKISKTPDLNGTGAGAGAQHGMTDETKAANEQMMKELGDTKPHTSKNTIEKKELKFDKAVGGITIAELFKNKKKYEGQRVSIRVQVTKFSPAIMNTNWLHLQDGTEFEGKYDLTATTDKTLNVGDNVIVEGKIVLDKDFGYGYFYEVLMEETKVK